MTTNTLTQKAPRFKVGDQVHCPKTLYDETKGEITEVDKVYAEIDLAGNFIKGGLHTLESDTKSFSVPYVLEGDTLTVTIPAVRTCDNREHIRVSKFFGYAYTIKTPQMNTLFSERKLTLIK